MSEMCELFICKNCDNAVKDKWGIAVACSLMDKKYISNEHKGQPWCPLKVENNQ